MITPLDTNTWAFELYGGNAAFWQLADGTIYVVSQVRSVDNSFVVLKSNPVPPDPGPGWSFTQVASYTFPDENQSFDPVVAYDGVTGLIHIIGTQDSTTRLSPPIPAEVLSVDLIKFAFDTSTNSLSGPVHIFTASVVRDGYDICPLSGGHTFVVAATTNPLYVDSTIGTTAQVTEMAISGNILTVTADNTFSNSGAVTDMQTTFSGLQVAQFLNGVTVTLLSAGPTGFTASYAYAGTYSQASSPPVYESGFATWLPGHSLLGFELDGSDIPVGLPVMLDNSPFRTGPVFGSASACSPDGSTVEVYYESHPKDISFVDQVFTVYEVIRVSGTWGDPVQLTDFTGRYTDNRLTVIPVSLASPIIADARLASLVFFTQDFQRNTIVGNVLIGYCDETQSPPVWAWKISSSSGLGGSVVQATPSLTVSASPPILEASVSYLLEPLYNRRGEWSYTFTGIRPQWQDSYAVNDLISYAVSDSPPLSENYVCIVSMRNRGPWLSGRSYFPGDIVEFSPAVYYISLAGVAGSYLNPMQDDVNWEPLPSPSSDSTHWAIFPTAWSLYAGSLDLSTLGIVNSEIYGDLNLTWLRGTKSLMDSLTSWALVGEASTGTGGLPYYVSHFDVPPAAVLTPLDGFVERGTPFFLDAGQTYDPDQDVMLFTWSLVPSSSDIHLVPSSDETTAELSVSRAVGGAEIPLSVAVVVVDYENGNPLHPPMAVSNIAYDHAANRADVTVDAASLAGGEKVLLYQLQNATFLINAVLTVLASPAPTSTSFSGTVQFAVPASDPGSDYASTPDIGYAIAAPQFAITDQYSSSPPLGLTVPFNASPVITMPVIPSVARNSYVTVIPTITGDTDPDDLTTYMWEQVRVSSPPIENAMQATGTDTSVLTFSTDGANMEGEGVEWSLTVDDGVNPPVTGTISIPVDAYDFTDNIDTLRLSRSMWPGHIAQRNTTPTLSPPMEWEGLDVSSIYTDFSGVKRTSVLPDLSPPTAVPDRYIVISPFSVLVYMEGTPGSVLRKLFLPLLPPAVRPLILDAVHTEEDYTLVLADDGKLYRYLPSFLINMDDPDIIIDLSDISGLSFTKIFSTVSFGGSRILVLSGPDGCLLLQVLGSDLTVQAMLEISTVSKLLYGANNVQFVRLANVENVRSGKIFLGTIGSDNSTYETLVDLSQGRIIGTWDKSKLINQQVTSGEILFEPEDVYSGRPLSPLLHAPLYLGPNPLMPGLGMVSLSWAQVRPDLCNGYIIQYSQDGIPQPAVAVGSGSMENLVLTLAQGHTYAFQIIADSMDGQSGLSNTESISI